MHTYEILIFISFLVMLLGIIDVLIPDNKKRGFLKICFGANILALVVLTMFLNFLHK
jgi:hypothetical protein